MKKRTVYITLFLIFIIGLISLIGTFAIDSTITEGNSTKADYLFNITLGDRTNREIVIPSYDSKIVDIKISNPNEFNMSYLLYLDGINSNISIINISGTESSGILNSKTNAIIKVFIQNNSSSDITTSIKDIVGFEKEKLSVPSNNTSINKETYYKVIVKSNDNTYGKVKPNIKLSANKGIIKYTLVPNAGYQYKSTTCNGTVSNNILTISNITSNTTCEVVFEPIQITVNFDLAGGVIETTYTEPQEYTYTVPCNGIYKIELWGAQGGGTNGGKGAYTAGTANFNTNETLNFYIGGAGNSNGAGGYNGGGNAGVLAKNNDGGGGSTDVRVSSSINDRIMVAAGGGGANANGTNTAGIGKTGGSAGGLSGYSGTSVIDKMYGMGGTQTSGGSKGQTSRVPGTDGKFFAGGIGGISSNTPTVSGGGGGGGGYYGGGSGEACLGNCGGSGGGGSSYISGHTGCVAITSQSDIIPKAGCTTGTTDNSCSIHYSGKKFTNTVMIDGQGYSWTNTKGALQQMPNPSGGYYASEIGNSGNGAAKITLMSDASYKSIYNTKYSNLPTPTRSGYTFDGWYTGENGTGTKVTSDTLLTNENDHTLYAKWIKDVKVTFDNNIFSTSSNSMTVNGLSINYDPSTSYLTLNGTPTSSGITFNKLYGLNFTLNEQYAIKTTYVSGSFKDSGSTGGCFVIEIRNSSEGAVSTRTNADLGFTTSYGESTLTINSSTVNEGHSFDFWLYFNTPTDWTFTNYKVKIDVTKVESKTVKQSQQYGTLPTPTRSGYTFDGWYTGENGTGAKITSDTVVTNANNHTLYAHWIIKVYTITFNKNGGTGGTDSVSIAHGTKKDNYPNITLPTMSGYIFDGYYDSASGGTQYYSSSGYSVRDWNKTSNTTLYAQWKQNARVPTFTYTGSYQIVDDNDNVISNPSTYIGNWKIRFLSSGTLTFSDSTGIDSGIDIFVVGGGGNGARGGKYIALQSRGGGGGGGGAAITIIKFPASLGNSYSIVIGGSQANSSFGLNGSAYFTALAGGTPEVPSYTSSGGHVAPVGSGGAGRLSEQTSYYGASNVIVQTGGAGNGSVGNYEFNGSSGKRYGAGGSPGTGGVAQSAGGYSATPGSGGSDGGGKGGAGCSFVNQGSGYSTYGGYDGSAATANSGSGGGGGGGYCGYSSTSTGTFGWGAAGGSGIVIIRNTR